VNKTIVFFFLSILLATSGYGQVVNSFSPDPVLFIDQFEEFMSKNISNDDEIILDRFIEGWKTDSLFFYDKKENIIKTCNLLKERKARPSPDFIYYLLAIEAYRNIPSKMDTYEKWEEALSYYLKNNKVTVTKIRHFIKSIPLLLEDNILFSSSYLVWKSSSGDFDIEVSDDGVRIVFEKTALVCYSKKDSINIYETSGWADPIENSWQGNGGLVTWERAGFGTNEVFAKLGSYQIELKKSEYTASNVDFTSIHYFDSPLDGDLEDAVRMIKDPSDATYPRFTSYTKVFELKDFFENIDYVGGLSMRGAKLVGTGTVDKKANLFLYNNDTLFMKAASVYFAFTKDKVTGRNTEVTFFLERDSIYHPDLLFNYFDNRKELNLLRTEDYTSQGPYFNSYHNIDMIFEQLTWRYGEPFLQFTMSRGSTLGNARFESVNFFNMRSFEEIQLRDPEHPLVVLKRFSRAIKSNEFSGEEFAIYMHLPVHQVRGLLMRMSFLGFIFYNFETDEVFMKEKLDAYLESASGRRDYDVISLNSLTYAPLENAVLNLENFDLIINGMPRVFISDSQNVNIFPAGEKIIMKRNRSFQFDGTVEAGLFTFWGNNFFFNYDSFKINLQNIDSINIRFVTDKKDNYGFNVIGNVESMVRHVTGELIIDKHDNKSGKEHHPQYPIFKSRERSYVYYDDKSIQSGVYRPETFYFHLYPFEIDSLNNFKASGLSFDGTLHSSNIFPVFDEQLRLQQDNSMGFRHKTEQTGMPIYQGKGNFYDIIHLSNAGLKGLGTLEYLTSATRSDDFNFLPDSMKTHAQEFQIAKKTTVTQYPMVKSKDVYVHWEPYKDTWLTQQEKMPFIMYNDSTTLSGSILLQPSGLTGKGSFDMQRAVMASNAYLFRADDFDAKHSEFTLRSVLEGIAVETDSVDIHIDYLKKRGDFTASNGFSTINYPENKYITHVDQFSWIMDRQELEFKKMKQNEVDDGVNGILKGATYISTDPQRDSLQFVSPLGIYNYARNTLNAKETEFFHVADALIYPNKGDVFIEPKGAMRPLVKSKILANTISRFHNLHTANITVSSSKKYEGNAIYDYVDENQKIQQIFMNEIGVNDSLYTYGQGYLTEEDSFSLSPYFEYQGKVALASGNKYLNFDGFSRVVHNCGTLPPTWLQFTSDINPDSIYIPVTSKMKELNGRYIFAGPMIRYDSIHVYPAFFSVWQNYSDNPILASEGFLHYDHGGDRYKIASAEKINDFNATGNYLSFNREFCELYGEGQVNLNIDLGQVQLKSVGNIRYDVPKENLKLDILLGVDFHIREDIMAIAAKDIDSIPGTQPVDINALNIKKGYYELIGKEETDKYYENLSLYGLVDDSYPKGLRHTLFFNDLKLVWNPVSRSYQSIGDIGVGNINGRQINRYVKGFVEIDRKRSGDKMDIYLQIDDKNWYYFGYTRGVMQVISSNKNFIELVRNLKNKERKTKVKGIKEAYNIIVSTDRKYLMFIRRWEEVLEEREREGIQ
jgi:hypothetical protein